MEHPKVVYQSSSDLLGFWVESTKVRSCKFIFVGRKWSLGEVKIEIRGDRFKKSGIVHS